MGALEQALINSPGSLSRPRLGRNSATLHVIIFRVDCIMSNQLRIV